MFIESPRLYLRHFTRDDFKYFISLHKNDQTTKFMGKGLISDEEIQKRFENVLKHGEEFGFSAGAVFEKETDIFIGRCGLVKIGTIVPTEEDHSDKVEIGYAFLPESWGKGYCQEIVPLVLKYGFETLKLETIFAKTSKENKKSQHLITEKFHFKYYSDVMVEGRDSLLFSLGGD